MRCYYLKINCYATKFLIGLKLIALLKIRVLYSHSFHMTNSKLFDTKKILILMGEVYVYHNPASINS